MEERVYGREVDGYYDQPNTLQSKYYAIQSYFGESWDNIPSQAEILIKAYRESEHEFIQDISAFQSKDWLKFTALIQQYNLELKDWWLITMP